MKNIHQQLHNYKVLKVIGHGTFATVSLIARVSNGQILALKTIQTSKMNQKQIDYSLNQVRLLSSIHIPNIIKYEGAYYHEITGEIGIVMEYANGGDLQQKIREAIEVKHKRGFEQQFIWKVAFDVLKGLKKLHQHKIVHRDIKTANIFFVNDVAKLGDLNVSRVLQKQLMCSTMTGTPYYMSPEIWNGDKYNNKCDIWAFGCVIYQMCSFIPPFKARDFATLQRKVNLGQYQHISYAYSDQLIQFVNRCLKVNPEDRPNAKELLQTVLFKNISGSRTEQQGIIELTSPIKAPKKINFHRRVQTEAFQEKKANNKKNVRFGDTTKHEFQNQSKEDKTKIFKRGFQKVKSMKQKSVQKDQQRDLQFPEINNRAVKQKKPIKVKTEKHIKFSQKVQQLQQKRLKPLKQIFENNDREYNFRKQKQKAQSFKIRVRSKSKSFKIGKELE